MDSFTPSRLILGAKHQLARQHKIPEHASQGACGQGTGPQGPGRQGDRAEDARGQEARYQEACCTKGGKAGGEVLRMGLV